MKTKEELALQLKLTAITAAYNTAIDRQTQADTAHNKAVAERDMMFNALHGIQTAMLRPSMTINELAAIIGQTVRTVGELRGL